MKHAPDNLKTVFAKKSFGQNFLSDQNFIDKIIAAVNPQKGETIIEIGAGRGALTEKLLEANANVIAIELEREMIAVLKGKFSTNVNFTLIEADALKVSFQTLCESVPSKCVKLVANLPYYISTAILQKIIEERDVFSEAVLMFQKEVVERITARPNEPERGFLSVIVEAFCHAEKLFDVPPTAFRPSPKVWSGVVSLKFNAGASDNVGNKRFENSHSEKYIYDLFREIVGRGFAQRRKTIYNNLKSVRFDAHAEVSAEDWQSVLRRSNIEPSRRAESLSLDEWQFLTQNVAEMLK